MNQSNGGGFYNQIYSDIQQIITPEIHCSGCGHSSLVNSELGLTGGKSRFLIETGRPKQVAGFWR